MTCGQGTFRNLDFEEATVPDVPAGQYGSDVPVTAGLPGWTAYVYDATNPVTTILHNNFSLGAPAVAILGPFWSPGGILQGQYSVRLQASFPSLSVMPFITQTGTLPSDTKSIRFYCTPYYTWPGISFGGQQMPVSILGGSSSTHYVFGGDISAFAGQTGELRFWGDASLDFIQFSTEPIPEPSEFGLYVLGALLLGWQLRRKPKR
jgi:hypothetical protein